MVFSADSLLLYLLAGGIILFVVAQSVFFMLRAIRQAKTLGITGSQIKKTLAGSAVFSLAPALAILIGVIALAGKLGPVLPWLRLSIIGALTYETAAAANAIEGLVQAGEVNTAAQLTASTITASQFTTIALVMALGVVTGLILSLFLVEKYQKGLTRIDARDPKWSKIMMSALFLGMIATFLGMVFQDIGQGLAGWIPVLVMLVSALVMTICAVLVKKLKWAWLSEYALPIAMLTSMLAALPLTRWLH